MADKNMNDTPYLPATGPNTTDPSTQAPVAPPPGNALDPTPDVGSEGPNESGIFSTGRQPDPESELHTVGVDATRHGALGKTDVNLGQDTPIDAGAEGLNLNDLDDEKAA